MTQPAEQPVFRYDIRPATADDHRFILETTAKVRQPHGLPWTTWKRTGMQQATEALRHGSAWVVESDGVLLGFVVADEAVSMLYVKRDYRGLGLGLELLAKTGQGKVVRVRQPTASWRAWARRRSLPWQVW